MGKPKIRVDTRYVEALYNDAYWPERCLLAAIIKQAVHDVRHHGCEKLPRRWQFEAQRWFGSTDSNFELVCQLLGLDPVEIRARLFRE
jgi:hypothetical protein